MFGLPSNLCTNFKTKSNSGRKNKHEKGVDAFTKVLLLPYQLPFAKIDPTCTKIVTIRGHILRRQYIVWEFEK